MYDDLHQVVLPNRTTRVTRIFADGAVAAAVGDPPVAPSDLTMSEQHTWYDGFDYRCPSFLNLNKSWP